MDWNLAFQIVAPIVASGMVAYTRSVQNKLDDLRVDLTTFRLKVAEEYVKHTALDEIKATLRRIEEKLDGKADKAVI